MKTITTIALTLSSFAACNASAADQALDHCLNAAQALKKGSLLKLEKLKADGKTLYEIEVKDAEGQEWEFICDTASGKIVEQEGEASSADSAPFKSKAKISEKDAAAIALKAHPGKIEEVEYEIEADGSASYEFDIIDDKGAETKVEVDAATGKIIETAVEEWEIGEESDERK